MLPHNSFDLFCFWNVFQVLIGRKITTVFDLAESSMMDKQKYNFFQFSPSYNKSDQNKEDDSIFTMFMFRFKFNKGLMKYN